MELDKKLDKLLRMGLADTKRLQYYERIMSNLKYSINIAEYRPIILKVLNKLISNTINDPMIFQKTQQNLLKDLKEEKKVKKLTKVPPTQTNDLPQPNPMSCDRQDSGKYNEEVKMTKLDLIKNLVKEQLLTELGGGVALGKNTSGAPQKPRHGVKLGKSATPAKARNLLNQARKRNLDAQRAVLKRTQNQAAQERQDQQYKAKQSEIQDKTRNVR